MFKRKIRESVMKRTLLALTMAGALGLAGCGTNSTDRAVTGGALGAAGGAAVGAMVGNPLAGAVIGGVGGAATGALTSPRDVNLGRPIYR
jgi:osmotically inducible lipoprotein OsmB